MALLLLATAGRAKKSKIKTKNVYVKDNVTMVKTNFDQLKYVKVMYFRFLKLGILLLLFTFGTSCTRIFYRSHHHHHKSNHAPGQIKKRTGSKSAKPYAPGQKKKRHRHEVVLQF
ncbi:hypothetical protein ACFO5O_13835 [Geojedonia litorea]|uniref:Uncharacterized protein n=1 Tax=Geojedonia litorea TaxID=1268269 RepID=A0ABV9N6D4_9FLAO